MEYFIEVILKRLCIYILVLNYGTAISVGHPPYRINFIPIGFTKCGSVYLSPFYFNFFFQYENLRWKIFMLLIEKKYWFIFIENLWICNWYEMIES